MLLGFGSPYLLVSSSHLICRLQCSWAWNQQVRGAIPNWLRCEPYFLSSHMLYLTSQSTKLSDFSCFEVLRLSENWNPWIKWKPLQNNGAKTPSGWRDMQITAPFPMQSTHLGCRYYCVSFKEFGKPWFHVTLQPGILRNCVLIYFLFLPRPAGRPGASRHLVLRKLL
jgi:hypothetical protein